MQYRAVQSHDLDDLQDKVRVELEAGWVPLGGIAMAATRVIQNDERKGVEEIHYTTHFVQALFR